MKSDPIDMAATLIANHRPFVLALVIGVAGRANEYAGVMTIFAPNGTVLAGDVCGLPSAELLRESVQRVSRMSWPRSWISTSPGAALAPARLRPAAH